MRKYEHVDENIEHIVGMADHIRTAHIFSDRFVEHKAIQKILAQADFLLARPKPERITGLVVKGEPGSGKTSLIREIRQRHKPTDGRWPIRPIVSITMTHVTKGIEVYKRILECLEVPIPRKMSGREDWARHAREKLTHFQVRLTCIDEMSDILQTTDFQQKEILTSIKYLMNEAKVPIYAFGIRVVEDLMHGDPHLKARFKELEIPDWTEDVEFRGLLSNYEKRLPLRFASVLDGPEKAGLLNTLGHGRLKEIVELINIAAVLAVADGTERITANHLRDVADGKLPPLELVEAAKAYTESAEGSWLIYGH